MTIDGWMKILTILLHPCYSCIHNCTYDFLDLNYIGFVRINPMIPLDFIYEETTDFSFSTLILTSSLMAFCVCFFSLSVFS